MKKVIVLILAVMMILLIPAAAFADEEELFAGDEGKIVTSDLFAQDAVFEVFADSFKDKEAAHEGTLEYLDYTTDVYEDGVTYDKWCRVYLPYGYDPEDTDTKYNVIYFQHGNTCTPNVFFDFPIKSINGIGGKNLLDNLFDPEYGVMEPCIIVCPTYYFYAPKDDWHMTKDDDVAAGDGRYEGIPGNYYQEVIEDLIPAVESKYNVYCEDFSEEGIRQTREHRAWAGYSRGSYCTWYMFYHDLEYFKYWMPCSGSVAPDDLSLGDGMQTSPEEAYAYIKSAIDAHPDLGFYIFTSLGGDADASSITAWIPQMTYFAEQTDTFSFGKDPSVNNFYAARSEFPHNDMYMPYSLYNVRDIFFAEIAETEE